MLGYCWAGFAALVSLPVAFAVLRYAFDAARKGDWPATVGAALAALAAPALASAGFALLRQQRSGWAWLPGLSILASALLAFVYAMFLRMDGP